MGLMFMFGILKEKGNNHKKENKEQIFCPIRQKKGSQAPTMHSTLDMTQCRRLRLWGPEKGKPRGDSS